MSTTVNFSTVTNSIEALSITGVTILDIDEIAESVGLDNHILAPIPDNFITGVELTRDEVSAQLLVLRYTLNYRYFHTTIAKGMGGLFDSYTGLITNMAAILLAFSKDETLSGALDNEMPVISNIGPVADPAGNVFHGFDISLRITQLLEV